MQLYDKDLLSVQEVRELVEAAKEAQQELARMDQAQVDRIVRAIADAGVRNARRLAQMANEDTGFGIVDDKVIKNIFASRGVYEHIKDMKTIGEISRDDAKRLRTIAVPVGVIAGLIPSTNPTSTALYKAEIAIKAGNAIVFSPHPTALRCILETVKVIRQAVHCKVAAHSANSAAIAVDELTAEAAAFLSKAGAKVTVGATEYSVASVDRAAKTITLASAVPTAISTGTYVYSTEAGKLDSTTRVADDVHITLVFGKDAYGVIDLDGGALQTIIKGRGSAGTDDPLDQRATAGAKVMGYTATILNDLWLLRIEHGVSA